MDEDRYGFSYTYQNFLDMEMDIDWKNIKFEFESNINQVPCFNVHENNFSEMHNNYRTANVIQMDETSQDQQVGSEFDDFIEFDLEELIDNCGTANAIQMGETSQDQQVGSEFDDFIEFNPDELIEEVHDDEDVKFSQSVKHCTKDEGGDTLYFCTSCTLDFPSLAYLKRHFDTKKHKRALAMQQRGKKFNQKRKYVRKNQISGISASKANLKIVTDLTLEEIAMLHGSDEQKPKIKQESSAKNFYESFATGIDSDSEDKVQSSDQEYLRSNVVINNNYVLPKPESLKQETIIYTAVPIPVTSNELPQKPQHFCQWCNKVFNLRCHYTQHVNCVHSGNRNFKCLKCGKKYPSQDMLNMHMEKHTDNKPFKCNKCERSYNNKVDLKRHEKTHQDVKDHICKICGNGFVRFDHLQKHYAVHQKRISMGLGDKIRSGRGLPIKNEFN